MSSLKQATASTLKWNSIDRLASQVLYAAVGVVLANVLSKEDFGLVGALLVFQSFATIFVDSGFGAALLQKKEPSQQDYSTVFWFNILMSAAVYALLWIGAPWIARIFQDDLRLIPLSKVMWLSFVINALAIVQTNRLMKRMDVKMIALSNLSGLIISGAIGIWLACTGAGPWALVWQSVSLASVKTVWLWATGHWWPSPVISLLSLRHMWKVGTSVFSTSMLNTIFLNAYNFIIGACYSLGALGLYTQADKWSKMGSASLSQILTASFVPLLSKVQDDASQFARYVDRIDRFTSLLLFPFMLGTAVMGPAIFHLLFASKWDTAIPLFQILSIRGIFVVLISLHSNYILSLGRARRLVAIEIVKDLLIIGAIAATLPLRSIDSLVWGQLAASAVAFAIVMRISTRATAIRALTHLKALLPGFCCALTGVAAAWLAEAALKTILPAHISLHVQGLIMLASQSTAGIAAALLTARLLRLPELKEIKSRLRGRRTSIQ